MVESRTYIAVPPGETIKEVLEDRGMTQKELAARMDISEKHISKLINGEVHLTYAIASKLETVLGIPAKFWNNLEAEYQDSLVKAKEENQMDQDIKLVKGFPYSEMAKNHWIPKTRSNTEKVKNLRKYFEVVDLSLVWNLQDMRIACRQLSKTQKSDFALLAWAQRARIEARSIETQPINVEKLKEAIPQIRSMTTMLPQTFCPKLKEILQTCGIALVLLPHIEGSFLHGATFYEGKKIVIGLTLRGKDADKFWFGLFHELGHIVLGHIGKEMGTSAEDEANADEFAKNILISPYDYQQFIARGDFGTEAILQFAISIKIDKGIIVGRLQKEKIIPYNQYNSLKTRYEFK